MLTTLWLFTNYSKLYLLSWKKKKHSNSDSSLFKLINTSVIQIDFLFLNDFVTWVYIKSLTKIFVSICVCVCAYLGAQSCPTLCDPTHCSPPGSSLHGIFQVRIWSGLPFPPPGDLPNPGIELASLVSPVLQADSLLLSHRGSHTHTYLVSITSLWSVVMKRRYIKQRCVTYADVH